MTRWKLTIEYDGKGYCGWQKQPDAPSIQKTIEEAIARFSDEGAMLHVAGRTDAGVHARGQVAHVDLAKVTTARIVRDAVNYYLRPHKISILSAEQVDKTFHARFGALERSYRYIIVNRRAPLTFDSDYAWHIQRELDVEAMQKAARLLIGPHDFSTFRAQHCQAKSPNKTLDRLDITRKGEKVIFYTAARSFLYHQVRNMVGSLHLVGSGRWTLADFQTAFAACDRTKGGPTAPAQGLYFWNVTYPQN